MALKHYPSSLIWVEFVFMTLIGVDLTRILLALGWDFQARGMEYETIDSN